MAKGAAPKKLDPVRTLADQLRGRHGIENHAAVLGVDRVEYFRSKDFTAFFQEHPDKMLPGIVQGSSAAKKDPMESVRELLHIMMKRGLVIRGERLYKKPKPGRKRLSKWPRKLQPAQMADQRWAEDAFYVWTYDLPTSPWFYVGAGGLVVLVLMLCLFPLAPYKIKIAVVYVSLSLVALILGTIALRGLVAFATWLVAGRALWLLPNALSETVGLDQAFWPLWELEEVGDDWWWGYQLPARAALAATSAVLLWGLATVSPGKGDLTAGAKATHDQILEWLNLQDAQFAQLEGLNVTEAAKAEAAKKADSERVRRQPVGGGGGVGGGIGVGSLLQKSAAQEVAQRMAEMKAKANKTATVPDEPVPEYDALLEEEVREQEAELAAQEAAFDEAEVEASKAEAVDDHENALIWRTKQAAAAKARMNAEDALAQARAALQAARDASAAGQPAEAAAAAADEAVEAAAEDPEASILTDKRTTAEEHMAAAQKVLDAAMQPPAEGEQEYPPEEMPEHDDRTWSEGSLLAEEAGARVAAAAKAAAEALIEEDPSSAEAEAAFLESQAAAGSYQSARERASAMIAEKAREYERKVKEAQAQGRDVTEL